MSDTDTAARSAQPQGGHADEDHAAAEHGHEALPPGPPDYRTWAAAIGGGAIGLIVAVALFAAAQS